jgi:lipopolysaccharide export system protein LptC
MKLFGKVEVLSSSGRIMNSYNLIVDQSNGGEVYKTNDSVHYQTQVSDIHAKRMHYDAKTKKVELMGGVLGVYE